MTAAHTVCRECGVRWRAGRQPRECINPTCEATWLDLPQFADRADADRAAARFAEERTATAAGSLQHPPEAV